MLTVTCNECSRIIPNINIAPACKLVAGKENHEVGDLRDAELCSVSCLRDWLDHEYPVRRPDWAAAHARIGAADPLYDTEKETAADALCDAIDAGLIGEPDPADEENGPLSENTRHLLFDHARALTRAARG